MLDASCTFPWLFEDEASEEADAMFLAIQRSGAAIPALWLVEIANGLGMAERRNRISASALRGAQAALRPLPLDVDGPASLDWARPVLDLMRTHRLTAYDATYLELALRLKLPLATLDRELRAAAPLAGVALFAAVP